MIDCERIGQWEDCMWSIFLRHSFSGHVLTQTSGNDQKVCSDVKYISFS